MYQFRALYLYAPNIGKFPNILKSPCRDFVMACAYTLCLGLVWSFIWAWANNYIPAVRRDISSLSRVIKGNNLISSVDIQYIR